MSHEQSLILRTGALGHQTPAERYWQARALVAETDAAQSFSALVASEHRAQLAERAHARAQERTCQALRHVEMRGELEGRIKAVQERGEDGERELARTRAALEVEREGSAALRGRIRELEKEKEESQGAIGKALRLVEAAQRRTRGREDERLSEDA